MTEEVPVLKAEIQKLKLKVQRRDARIEALKSRLLEKKKYERELLRHTGAAPAYIHKIDLKDQAVLKEDV